MFQIGRFRSKMRRKMSYFAPLRGARGASSLRHPKVKPATSEKVALAMPMGPRTTSTNVVDEAWPGKGMK